MPTEATLYMCRITLKIVYKWHRACSVKLWYVDPYALRRHYLGASPVHLSTSTTAQRKCIFVGHQMGYNTLVVEMQIHTHYTNYYHNITIFIVI